MLHSARSVVLSESIDAEACTKAESMASSVTSNHPRLHTSGKHALKTNLKIEYIFDGGLSGTQNFDYDYDDYMISADGKIVVVTKNIQLVS